MASAVFLLPRPQHDLEPALAATSAMPDPMIPDPTMPTVDRHGRRRYRSVTTGVHIGGRLGSPPCPGPLALVGGAECATAALRPELLERSGGPEVLVLPTAAAYEHPERAVEAASRWFAELGATVTPLRVLTRARRTRRRATPTAVDDAPFVYLAGGSPMHLRSVLKDTPLLDALVGSWGRGAVLAGSGAGVMVLCDPMVDPRGGAFTVGLELIRRWRSSPTTTPGEDKAKRTLHIAPSGMAVVGIDEATALIRRPRRPRARGRAARPSSRPSSTPDRRRPRRPARERLRLLSR